MDYKGERCFDIKSFHPHIEPANDADAIVTYIKKDNLFVEEGKLYTKRTR